MKSGLHIAGFVGTCPQSQHLGDWCRMIAVSSRPGLHNVFKTSLNLVRLCLKNWKDKTKAICMVDSWRTQSKTEVFEAHGRVLWESLTEGSEGSLLEVRSLCWMPQGTGDIFRGDGEDCSTSKAQRPDFFLSFLFHPGYKLCISRVGLPFLFCGLQVIQTPPELCCTDVLGIS